MLLLPQCCAWPRSCQSVPARGVDHRRSATMSNASLFCGTLEPTRMRWECGQVRVTRLRKGSNCAGVQRCQVCAPINKEIERKIENQRDLEREEERSERRRHGNTRRGNKQTRAALSFNSQQFGSSFCNISWIHCGSGPTPVLYGWLGNLATSPDVYKNHQNTTLQFCFPQSGAHRRCTNTILA